MVLTIDEVKQLDMLTTTEVMILNDLVSVHNRYIKLPVLNPGHMKTYIAAMNTIQQLILIRSGIREIEEMPLVIHESGEEQSHLNKPADNVDSGLEYEFTNPPEGQTIKYGLAEDGIANYDFNDDTRQWERKDIKDLNTWEETEPSAENYNYTLDDINYDIWGDRL